MYFFNCPKILNLQSLLRVIFYVLNNNFFYTQLVSFFCSSERLLLHFFLFLLKWNFDTFFFFLPFVLFFFRTILISFTCFILVSYFVFLIIFILSFFIYRNSCKQYVISVLWIAFSDLAVSFYSHSILNFLY